MQILYEDRALLVCVKPAGVLSQETEDARKTMPLLIREYLGQGAYVGVVHRLDQEVGGVMVFAKEKAVAAPLTAALSQTGEKIYWAVVQGEPVPQKGEMRDLLFHDSRKNKSYAVKRMRKGVREAWLEYSVKAQTQWREQTVSLVQIRLHTGRTHQIRVQFSSRQHPIFGDRKYGGAGEKTMGLWSGSLTFRHPETGKFLTFTQAPPEGMPWELFRGESKNFF